MKNIIEVMKANKGTIAKRGLIVVGALAGLAIAGKALITKNSVDEDETVVDWTTEVDESEEDSDEE